MNGGTNLFRSISRTFESSSFAIPGISHPQVTEHSSSKGVVPAIKIHSQFVNVFAGTIAAPLLMEAVGLFDFRGEASDELSFRKGALLIVMNVDAEKNWCKAELNGKTGLVPKVFVKMKPNPWFKGKLSRAASEDLLRKETRDGIFVVRESESTPGDFSISVLHKGQVKHLKVLRDEAGKFFIWDKKYPSLNQLVLFHKTSSVSRIDQIFLQVPQGVLKVRATFDFSPKEEGELLLHRGDVVSVIDHSDKNWWTGDCNGQTGMFPVAYVEKIE